MASRGLLRRPIIGIQCALDPVSSLRAH
jgi:hypothetical protein